MIVDRDSQHGDNRQRNDNVGFVSLYLASVCNDREEDIFFNRRGVSFELSARAGDYEKYCNATNCDFLKKKPLPSFGWQQFELRATFLGALTSDEDPITLKLKIKSPDISLSMLSTPTALADSVASTFLGNKEHGDVIFRLGTRELHAHRGFLSARSEYFSALFNSGMRETRDLTADDRMVVTVTDFSYDEFFVMMRYLHTGSLNFLAGPDVSAASLFKISDKYNVQGLRDAMEDCIVDNMDVGNVVATLFDFAHRFPTLRQTCLDFIAEHFDEVRKTGLIEKVEWSVENYRDYAELMNEIVKIAPDSVVHKV
ncbi:BTB/POZ protein [Jimgerdemannia flammicorona]|uniref:BTB/POZ protein n=1 Tax=Jimgerdemannia flammicorona TaxID=994334 RepID=A0A433Q210_9FUNG|nr:BTB/POZ protein [Jimgerdemannia flammicorona]